MRKVIFLLFVAVLPFLFASKISAQAGDASQGISAPGDIRILPPPTDSTSFLGQNHNYTLVFRGNGEAVVSLRVTFRNKGESSQNKFTLRVPKVEPKDLAIYQIIKERVCSRYGSAAYDPVTRSYPQAPCLEYQDPDYFEYYYGNSKYAKANFDYQGDTITLTLPQAVSANKSGAFFVFFRATGYVNKNVFGAHEYTFETLKVDDDISNLQIGISTDSDLILKGVKGEVDYRFQESGISALKASGGSTPVADSAVDNFVNQIGQGSISKSASNLAALESYKVEGAYAESLLKLYAKEVVVSIAIFVFVAFLAVLVIGFVLRSFFRVDARTKEKNTIGNVMSPASSGIKSALGVLALSFLSSLFISGYSILLFFLISFMDRFIYYSYQTYFALFLVIISFGVYAILLFAPGILLGVKKGVFWGIAQVIMTVFWLIFFVGVAVFVFFVFGNPMGENYLPIYPLMEKGI